MSDSQTCHESCIDPFKMRKGRSEECPIAPFVAMPFVTSSFLLLVVRPGAPSSVLDFSQKDFMAGSTKASAWKTEAFHSTEHQLTLSLEGFNGEEISVKNILDFRNSTSDLLAQAGEVLGLGVVSSKPGVTWNGSWCGVAFSPIQRVDVLAPGLPP